MKHRRRATTRRPSVRTIAVAILFVLGLGIFLFPLITTAINARSQSYAVQSYQEWVEALSPSERVELRREAEAHNDTLHGGTAPLEDPFPADGQEPPAERSTEGVSHVDLLALETVAHLEIPRLRLDLPVYNGTGDAVLQKGVGHIPNSSLPVGGIGTHAVLTGHRGLPTSTIFRHLDEMEVGDVFYLHALGETLAYQVAEISVVLPGDFGRLGIDQNRDLVTLVTCDPYMINSHRLLVTGERIPFADGLEESIPASARSATQQLLAWMAEWGLALGGLAALGVVLAWHFRRRGGGAT